MKKIIFVTGNKNKLAIAKAVLEKYDIEIENIDLDVDEVQDTNIENIAQKSAILAANILNKPVIKTDVGFEIEALNGFPGAFGKYVLNQLGTEGMLKLLENKTNRRGNAIEVLAYAKPNGETKIFRMDTEFVIRQKEKDGATVMDKLMEIKGQNENYGSATLEKKIIWWKENYNYFDEFAKWFIENN